MTSKTHGIACVYTPLTLAPRAGVSHRKRSKRAKRRSAAPTCACLPSRLACTDADNGHSPGRRP